MRVFPVISNFGILFSIIAAAAVAAPSSVLGEPSSKAHLVGCVAEKAEFKAWVDEMPMAGHKLIVVGKVQCPTTGWQVTLVEAKPVGINPSILLLALKATPPAGMAGQMVTHVGVRFELGAGKGYQEVTIRGGGPEFSVPVGVVH